MLFAHFLIANYQRGDDHPIWNAIVHWLACLALTVAMWLAVAILFMLLIAAIGG